MASASIQRPEDETRETTTGPEAPGRFSAARGRSPDTTARLLWIDALKTVSILGVIGIHVTADSSGLPFASHPASERVGVGIARALSEAFNYPVFLVTSLFLLALGLDHASHRRSYSEVIRLRLQRLLPPFVVWSLVFLAVRHVKAIAFGYHGYYLEELATPISWPRYLFLGGAQYHLHFIPILLALTLLYPIYRVADRWPICGALVLLTLVLWPRGDALVYAALHSSPALPFALTATKVVGFTGYGFVAFSLYGAYQRGIPRVFFWLTTAALAVSASVAGILVLEHGMAIAREGTWLERDLATHMAHYLLPVAVVFAFLSARRVEWPSVVSRSGSLAFGVYLCHPIVLDALEIAERGWSLSPVATVAFNFAAVSLISFLAVALASRNSFLRPVFGVARTSAA